MVGASFAGAPSPLCNLWYYEVFLIFHTAWNLFVWLIYKKGDGPTTRAKAVMVRSVTFDARNTARLRSFDVYFKSLRNSVNLTSTFLVELSVKLIICYLQHNEQWRQGIQFIAIIESETQWFCPLIIYGFTCQFNIYLYLKSDGQVTLWLCTNYL